jgi:two-component system, OmpR family, alkaline phosphatase synthesis response regulator PhoP
MAKGSILVVEDEADIRELIAYNLGREGYAPVQAESAERALSLLGRDGADLVLLDIMLPGLDGIALLKRLRGDPRWEKLPVIMLTAKGEDADIVSALELGADDYVVKPFSPRVLVARVRARLRETAGPGAASSADDNVVALHGLSLDSGRHAVSARGKPIELSATEFALLEFLMRNPGWVFSRAQIIDAVRGPDYPVTDRAVDVQVLGLRKRLGEAGDLVETVRGVGYRFRDAGRKP